jgi:hypothetical protein
MPDTKPAAAAPQQTPVVLDLGKQRRKRVKELRRGEGKLMADIIDALDELRTAGTLSANAQPVVVVVQQKRRKMKSLIPGF